MQAGDGLGGVPGENQTKARLHRVRPTSNSPPPRTRLGSPSTASAQITQSRASAAARLSSGSCIGRPTAIGFVEQPTVIGPPIPPPAPPPPPPSPVPSLPPPSIPHCRRLHRHPRLARCHLSHHSRHGRLQCRSGRRHRLQPLIRRRHRRRPRPCPWRLRPQLANGRC